jgi:hypothetical protein
MFDLQKSDEKYCVLVERERKPREVGIHHTSLERKKERKKEREIIK